MEQGPQESDNEELRIAFKLKHLADGLVAGKER
jgi:hypothetical protein